MLSELVNAGDAKNVAARELERRLVGISAESTDLPLAKGLRPSERAYEGSPRRQSHRVLAQKPVADDQEEHDREVVNWSGADNVFDGVQSMRAPSRRCDRPLDGHAQEW